MATEWSTNTCLIADFRICLFYYSCLFYYYSIIPVCSIFTNVYLLLLHCFISFDDLVDCYNKTLSDLLNKHAPLKSKLFRPKPSNPWFSPTLAKLKFTRCHLEKIWSSSHSLLDLKLLRSATNHYHAAIIKAKKTLQLFSHIIESSQSKKTLAGIQ